MDTGQRKIGVFLSEGREYHVWEFKNYCEFNPSKFWHVNYDFGEPWSTVALLKLTWWERVRMFFSLGLGRDVEKEYRRRVKQNER